MEILAWTILLFSVLLALLPLSWWQPSGLMLKFVGWKKRRILKSWTELRHPVLTVPVNFPGAYYVARNPTKEQPKNGQNL